MTTTIEQRKAAVHRRLEQMGKLPIKQDAGQSRVINGHYMTEYPKTACTWRFGAPPNYLL